MTSVGAQTATNNHQTTNRLLDDLVKRVIEMQRKINDLANDIIRVQSLIMDLRISREMNNAEISKVLAILAERHDDYNPENYPEH